MLKTPWPKIGRDRNGIKTAPTKAEEGGSQSLKSDSERVELQIRDMIQTCVRPDFKMFQAEKLRCAEAAPVQHLHRPRNLKA